MIFVKSINRCILIMTLLSNLLTQLIASSDRQKILFIISTTGKQRRNETELDVTK